MLKFGDVNMKRKNNCILFSLRELQFNKNAKKVFCGVNKI